MRQFARRLGSRLGGQHVGWSTHRGAGSSVARYSRAWEQSARHMSSVEIERRVRKLMELERLGDTKVLYEALQRKRELQVPKAPYDVDQMMEAHATAFRQDNPGATEIPEHPLTVGQARGGIPLLERPEPEFQTKDAYYNFRFSGGSRGPVAGVGLLLRVIEAAKASKRPSDLHLAASALQVAQVRRVRNSQRVTKAVAELATLGLSGPWISILSNVDQARLFLRGHAWLDIASARLEDEDTEGAVAALDGMWAAGNKCPSCLPNDDECARAAELEVKAGRPFHALRYAVRQRRLREPRLRVSFSEDGQKELVKADKDAPEAQVDPAILANVLCAAAGIDRETGEAGEAPATGLPSEDEDAGLNAAVRCFLRSTVQAGIAARDIGVGKADALRLREALEAKKEARAKKSGEDGEEEEEEEEEGALGPPEFWRARVPGGGELFPGSTDARVRAAWMAANGKLRVAIDKLQGGPSASAFDSEVDAARGGDEAALSRHGDLVAACRGLLGVWESVFGEELDVVAASGGVMFEGKEEEVVEEEKKEGEEDGGEGKGEGEDAEEGAAQEKENKEDEK